MEPITLSGDGTSNALGSISGATLGTAMSMPFSGVLCRHDGSLLSTALITTRSFMKGCCYEAIPQTQASTRLSDTHFSRCSASAAIIHDSYHVASNTAGNGMATSDQRPGHGAGSHDPQRTQDEQVSVSTELVFPNFGRCFDGNVGGKPSFSRCYKVGAFMLHYFGANRVIEL